MELKKYAKLPYEGRVTEEHRKDFNVIGFDPEELIQLKEMNGKKLTCLLLFCGIRVYNGVPLIVLEEDEMRMAFVIWRAERIMETRGKMIPKVERSLTWINLIQEAARMIAR